MIGSSAVYGQNTTRDQLSGKEQKRLKKNYLLRQEENGDYIYDHEFEGGGRLNTNGWDGYIEYGKRKDQFVTNIFQLGIGEIKDPKEDKQPGATLGQDFYGNVYSAKSFVFGKENNFYQVKLAFGQRRLIGDKGNKNGVAVSAIYMGGVSIGLLKPYYLVLYDSTSRSLYEAKYSDANKGTFLNPGLIYAGASMWKGWNELTVVPGVHARLGMRFDWAQFNEFVSALEVGINGDLYTKSIPIMVDNTAHQFFFNAYVSLLFGKRW